MKIEFNSTGGERKALVTAIGEVLGEKPEYKGAPTFIYQIGRFEVDKEGALIFDESVVGEKAVKLLDELNSRGFTYVIPEELVREMRSSVIFLGAMLSRCGKVKASYPGGCEIGSRPIDLHLKSLREMGRIAE
jgi:hypothetical protein